MAFGKIGDSYLFGLPGNPVAVMVTLLRLRARRAAASLRQDGRSLSALCR